MSRICPVLFVRNLSGIFSCLEYVQFYLSRICPEFFYVQKKFLEFFMSRICPVYLSRFCTGFFYVWNISGNFFSYPEFVWFFGHEKFQTATLIIFPDIFQTFSGHEKKF